MAAVHRLRARNPRTLDVLAEVAQFRSLDWTRRTLDMGEFMVAVPRALMPDAVATEDVLLWEVLRDGVPEFAGIDRQPELRDAGFNTSSELWTFRGPDLKWFLHSREIVQDGSEFDTVSGVTPEAAMKHYIEDHLSSGAGTRDLDAELAPPVTFDVLPDLGRGTGTVDFNGRWQRLLGGVLQPIAEEGDLWHELRLARGDPTSAPTGYEYDVAAWRDRTADVVFSPQRADLSGMVYKRDFMSLANTVYALGDGTGAARNIETAESISGATGTFRFEEHIDARDADDATKLQAAADRELARQIAGAVEIRVDPLTTGPLLYRRDWDLGDEVTVMIAGIGTFTRRIVEVRVELDENDGERQRISLGKRPRTLGQVLADLQRKRVPSEAV